MTYNALEARMAATTQELLDEAKDALKVTLARGAASYSVSTGAGPRALNGLSIKDLEELIERLERKLAREANRNVLPFGYGVAERQS
jgi:hypothetical protein